MNFRNIRGSRVFTLPTRLQNQAQNDGLIKVVEGGRENVEGRYNVGIG